MDGFILAPRRGLGCGLAALMLLVPIAITATPQAEAKGKKIHACVSKSGEMTFSRSGKCGKGERNLSWRKTGKRGKAGAAGPAGAQGAAGAQGPQGPAGPAGSSANIEALQALVEAQALTIASLAEDVDRLSAEVETLTSELAALTGDVDTLSTQMAAVCSQLADVTGQGDGVVAALDAINLLLDPLTLGTLPDIPDALGAFACP